MTGDNAIPRGQNIPDGYKQMAKSVCTECGVWYLIIHEQPFADADRARTQAGLFARVLGGEHHEERFVHHLDVYKDLD